MGRRSRASGPAQVDDPRAAVAALRSDPRILWLPVRHHSPGCALHIDRVLREQRPAAVLVEGPEDLDPLVPWLVHPATAPPVVGLVFHTDATGDAPIRVRTSWPLLGSDPEWVALRTGAEIGAAVRLIDAPVRAVYEAGARGLDQARSAGETRWFQALAERFGAPDFEAFWETAFEATAAHTPSDRFFEALLLFAWGARHVVGGAVTEATQIREAHLRYHVDRALEESPSGKVAVVTGAYHTVALPTVRGRKAKAKSDKQASAVLAAASERSVARLGLRYPAWAEARYAALRSGARPIDAATEILVRASRAARAAGHAVGTADAVGAVQLAVGLADRFGRPGAITAEHVLDAVRAAYVKGPLDEAHDPVLAAARSVLVGQARGRLPDQAGRPPLVEDFWAEIRLHRLDLGDDPREVRCDMERQEKHRAKSAFLHRCELLGIPMFAPIPGADVHFLGPDPVERSGLHLLIERWGIVRGDELDDVLIELTDHGDSVLDAASARLAAQRAGARSDAARAGAILLTGALCRLVPVLPELSDDLRSALAVDTSFVHLVEALQNVALLRRYPDIPTDEVRDLVRTAFERACLVLPAAGRVGDEGAVDLVEPLIALSRFAAEDETLDRRLLGERLWTVARDDAGQALVRGACWGLCSALGVTTPRAVGAELHAMLRGPLAQVRRGGAFLEGVLRTSRATFLTAPRLLDAVHDVLVASPSPTSWSCCPICAAPSRCSSPPSSNGSANESQSGSRGSPTATRR